MRARKMVGAMFVVASLSRGEVVFDDDLESGGIEEWSLAVGIESPIGDVFHLVTQVDRKADPIASHSDLKWTENSKTQFKNQDCDASSEEDRQRFYERSLPTH